MTRRLKKIAFLVPRPDLAPADFLHHWRGTHGPLVAHSPGYARWRQRYVQNHVQGAGPVGDPLPYAGMAEFWLPGDSPNEDEFSKTEVYRERIAVDERNFIDMTRTVSMAAWEDPVLPGQGPVKLVVLSVREPSVSAADWQHRYQREVVQPALAVSEFAARLRGWHINHVVEGSFRLPGALPTDSLQVHVMDEFWFDSVDDAQAGLPLAPWGGPLLSPLRQQSFLATEHVFFDHGRPLS